MQRKTEYEDEKKKEIRTRYCIEALSAAWINLKYDISPIDFRMVTNSGQNTIIL
jgi:hypothetical protein